MGILKTAPPQSHMVQFYGADDSLINRNTACFLAEGLTVGGALVIATGERNQAVAQELEKLGIDSRRTADEGRLCFLDAEETLAQFMVDGEPYWGRFEETITSAMRKIREVVGHGGLRAYGEMVGVLWTKGQHAAAVRLEYFWNSLLAHSSASLLCGYPVDLASPLPEQGPVEAVLCAHTHLIPQSPAWAPNRAPKMSSDSAVDGVPAIGPMSEIPAHAAHDLRSSPVKM